MAIMRLPQATRNALADRFAELLDVGESPAVLTIYTAPQPANANSRVEKQVALGRLTFALPSAPGASNGMVSFFSLLEDSSAAATGAAAWARCTDANGNVVFDCDVSGIGGGGVIELNTTAIVAGGPIRINSFVISFPAG